MKQINASIITIGDELLIGQTIDTNSAWMAQELNKIGVWVKRRLAIGDHKEDIRKALDEESRQADIILITGGLGPTADDITKPLLCEYFGGRLVVNEDVLAHVKYLFEKVYRRTGPMLERNLKQAEVPDNCTVLMNKRGTAPGMWFTQSSETGEKKIFISLPGVPHEMKGLMTDEVLPRLKQHFQMPVIFHSTVVTYGIGESRLAEEIKDWEENLPAHMKLAYLPHYGMVRLRLTATGEDESLLRDQLSRQMSKLKQLVKRWMVTEGDSTIAQTVSALFKKRKLSLATAESCTGGYIAHLLTTDAGASDFFKGTVVAYANEVKQNLLGVSEETIKNFGAVSEQTVKEMVKGVLVHLNTDYALATSGIMGPGGGSDEKPVGMVWIALGNRQQVITKEFHFRFERLRNIEMAALTALNELRKFVEGDKS